ncbi:MAG: amino acid ABC transporter permease, partial [Myxococcales bacterium]|nr:amino acid ABC transporter permease [Myxococcales bacterium]
MSRAQGLGARRCVVVVALSMALALGCESKEDPFVIGSKKFTESVLLADVMTLSARHGGIPVRHQREVGGTQILWSALLRGEVDAYPEYTGTLYKEILADETIANREELAAVLEKKGIRLGGNLGFNNTYAIGMRKDRAEELGIRTISDLVGHPDLIFGFDNEFIQREDGWKGLKARYGLPQTDVRGMSHDLSYRGLESGAIDAMEMYTTDGEIEYYDLQTIEDDRQFFPDYKALVLWRIDLEERSPELVAALRRLEGRIDEKRMIAMNSRAKLQRTPEARVAAQ